MYEYNATVKHIVDGDTVDFYVDCGFHITVTIRTRLADINAPELGTTAGAAAKTYITGLIPVGTACVIQTAKDPQDKYGRWVATIWAGTDTTQPSVNEDMLTSGNAVPYP